MWLLWTAKVYLKCHRIAIPLSPKHLSIDAFSNFDTSFHKAKKKRKQNIAAIEITVYKALTLSAKIISGLYKYTQHKFMKEACT